MIKTAYRKRRKAAIRKKVRGTSERPRLVVFRSLNHIYAQIVDDSMGKTLASASSKSKDMDISPDMKKTEMSFLVGQKLAEKARDAGVEKVVFDRAGYKYHGRVKALAEGARKAGLDF
ncbi:MAG: 50S ribosomal protein L18 [Candidatus Syntrophosphaera sp.]